MAQIRQGKPLTVLRQVSQQHRCGVGWHCAELKVADQLFQDLVRTHDMHHSHQRFRAGIVGVGGAVDRLRDGLAYNGLMLDGDERLLAGVLAGDVSSVELAEAICSARRMGLAERPAVH
jgi:hypothetical protein